MVLLHAQSVGKVLCGVCVDTALVTHMIWIPNVHSVEKACKYLHASILFDIA